MKKNLLARFAEEMKKNGFRTAAGKSFLKVGNKLTRSEKPSLHKDNNVNNLFPDNAGSVTKQFADIPKTCKRLAIFASFSDDGLIHKDVIYYLTELKKVTDCIIFVADNPLIPQETEKLRDLVLYIRCARHQEYDFGSYKRGYQWALEKGLLNQADELLFCNDSCYGPVYPFSEIFREMDTRDCDFWGIMANDPYNYHLQSYFLLLKKQVFLSDVFENFIQSVKKQKRFMDVVRNYEVKLTKLLQSSGFSCSSYIKFYPYCNFIPYNSRNLTRFPIWALKHRFPFVKKKMLDSERDVNAEGLYNTYEYIRKHYPEILNLVNYRQPEDCNLLYGFSFSIVMPVFNRKRDLEHTINSILRQTYQNFELIIVDDGSTDGTKELIEEKYARELETQKIRYFYVNYGSVCEARNKGLAEAAHDWIAYIDADSIMMGDFLKTFCEAIQDVPKTKIFYAKSENMKTGKKTGRIFNYKKLLAEKYIDLNALIHAKTVYQELGGFDEHMAELADWDLISTYTEKYQPQFINKRVLLSYKKSGFEPNEKKGNLSGDLACYRQKHMLPMVITVMFPASNAKHIRQALDKAICQTGWFEQKLLVCDTHLSDTVNSVIEEYVRYYPNLIKRIFSEDELCDLISHYKSKRACYVAFIVGDEFWCEDEKTDWQTDFLQEHRDCGMVFSNALLYDETQKKMFANLPEEELPEVFVNGQSLPDTIANKYISLSSCLFNAAYIEEIIEILQENNPQAIPLSACFKYFDRIGYIGNTATVSQS